jgi:hypothetical protein
LAAVPPVFSAFGQKSDSVKMAPRERYFPPLFPYGNAKNGGQLPGKKIEVSGTGFFNLLISMVNKFKNLPLRWKIFALASILDDVVFSPGFTMAIDISHLGTMLIRRS